MTDSGSDDVAVIVYREDDAWDVDLLPTALTEDLAGLLHVLHQQPSIGGTIGLAAVGDDFFVALRVIGGQASVFLSDLTAAVDWPLARQVLDYLDLVIPEDEDLDQVLPAGTCRSSPTSAWTRWTSAWWPATSTCSRTRRSGSSPASSASAKPWSGHLAWPWAGFRSSSACCGGSGWASAGR